MGTGWNRFAGRGGWTGCTRTLRRGAVRRRRVTSRATLWLA